MFSRKRGSINSGTGLVVTVYSYVGQLGYRDTLCTPWSTVGVIITINVPLFKKLRDIIFFWWDNHFMSHFEGHFEGAKTFLTP